MGLREEIEAAFGDAAAEGGVRILAIDGDEKVWVGGLAATDGTLEVRVGDRGPRRDLRRRRPDHGAMEALGFRDGFHDAWILPLAPGAGQAARGAAAAVSALWPSDDPLELPGFDLDGDAKLSARQVEPDEVVAAARTALDALGIGADDPLLIHLGD
jgi:hypothetical protein